MTGRIHRAIVLTGFVLAAGACKDEPSDSSAEGEAKDATAETPADGSTAKPEKAEPPPAPPTGHAVAKVGALLFTSSTGEVGVELPPQEEGSPQGFTVNVVGAQDGRLVVETLAAQPAEHHCAGSLSGLADFRLRLFMAEDDLLPVLTKELTKEHEDGTRVRVMPGVPVPGGESTTELDVLGASVPVELGADAIGKAYEPGPAFPTKATEGSITELEGHPLTVGTKTIAEQGLARVGGSLAHYGVEAKEGTGQSLVTVRNACVEYKALVDDQRFEERKTGLYALKGPKDAIPQMAKEFDPEEAAKAAGILGTLEADSGHFLASPYGAAFAEGDDSEDVWGGLTGTEVGEAYGVGGLGLVGTGRGGSGPPKTEYEVKAGTAIVWADGSAAGQVTADHRFEDAPREQEGRSCFDVSLLEKDSPSVTLCFTPGDVHEVESEGGGGGVGYGTIGLGNTGLIGKGGGGGTGSGYGRGSGAGFGGRGKRVPRVRQAKASVTGSLDKDIIRRIVRAHINEVRFCYNQGLAKDPSLEGKVSINFVIAATGKVGASTVADDTLADEKVGKCIAKAVKRWKFPRPAGGGTVVVTYPFMLEPG